MNLGFERLNLNGSLADDTDELTQREKLNGNNNNLIELLLYLVLCVVSRRCIMLGITHNLLCCFVFPIRYDNDAGNIKGK